MTRMDMAVALGAMCAGRDKCEGCPLADPEWVGTECEFYASQPRLEDMYRAVFGSDEKPAVVDRAGILDAARDIVCDGRPQEYGGPEDSFSRIADLWSVYTGAPIDAHDVAVMMALLKIARMKGGKYNRDNYIDLAGYAACAGEIGGVKNADG